LLTLLALILAIGLVVDDAIVVLENAQRRVDRGEPPLAAAFLGTRQVTFAVLATSAVLIAVYVPLSLLGGDVGRLFREFGLVLAAAVVISTFVALSLTPMLCSQLLGRSARPGRFSRLAEGLFAALERGYRRALERALGLPLVVLAVTLLLSVAAVLLYRSLPQELAPDEDRGVFFISANAPEGSTLDYTDAGARRVERAVQPLLDGGEAQRVVAIVGRRNSPNRAIVVVGLAPWETRSRGQQAIVEALRRDLGAIPDLRAAASSRSSLGRNVGSRSIAFVVGGPDYASVREWSELIAQKARENPYLADVDTDFEARQPTLQVEIDRPVADALGVAVERIAGALQTLLASREVTTYVDRGREYAVVVQARAADRRRPQDLQNIFVRAEASGRLVPLSAVVSVAESTAPLELNRFDRLPSVTVSASLVGDYDLGQAIAWFRQTAGVLPVEARGSFTGSAEIFLETSGSLYFVFGLALLVVFLVLAAQFESFVHPLIILLTVPVGVTGALLALALTGNSINLNSQIGGVLLIGLMAKNGILIVEFANQLRAAGLEIRAALLEAASQRLRPILMTVLSTILGALPLAVAAGAGAESRRAIGVVVIGGLAVSTLLTLFLTPVLYDLLARFTRPVNAVQQRLAAQVEAVPDPATKEA
nr:efflux RND transporter permease subunit [Pseudomonadota bacterium]